MAGGGGERDTGEGVHVARLSCWRFVQCYDWPLFPTGSWTIHARVHATQPLETAGPARNRGRQKGGRSGFILFTYSHISPLNVSNLCIRVFFFFPL